MSAELIDKYVDQVAIKTQTDFLVAELERAKKQYTALSNAIKNIKGSTSFADTSKIAQAAEKEQQALLKTQQQIIKAKQEQVKLENQLLQQQILQEKQAQANLKTTQQQGKVKQSIVTESITNPGAGADVIKNTGNALSDFDKQQAEAAISATEFGNSLNKSAKVLKNEVTPAVKASTLSTKQLALAKAEGAILAQKELTALKNQVREEIAVKGSLEQRRAALIRLNAVYDAQGPTERASAAGQRLQKIIGGLDTQVKTLESTTGRAQRNVGNYAGAFEGVAKAGTKAFGVLRTVANILPGFGISGVLLLAFEPLKRLVEFIFKASDAQERLAAKTKLLGEITAEANKNVGEEASNLRIIYEATQDVTLSTEDRTRAAKFLQQTYPETFKNFSTEQILLGQAKTGYDELTKSN